MKRLIAAFILIITVIGLALSAFATIDSNYKRLTAIIEKAEDLSEKGKSTEQQLSTLKKNWEKTEPMLMFFANHDNVENIGITVNRLVALSNTTDKEAFKAEAEELKTRLKYLKKSESFTFESVF